MWVETWYDLVMLTSHDLVKCKTWHLCKIAILWILSDSFDAYSQGGGSLIGWVADQFWAGTGGPTSKQQQRQQTHTLMVLLYVKDFCIFVTNECRLL